MREAERVCRTEVISHEPAEALANLLGVESPASYLPSLWHWVYLLERRPHRDLGPDGHPSFGIPAPPGPGRRRMFAGGRVTTLAPLEFGSTASRTTWVARTSEKVGTSGSLSFVTIRSEYRQHGRVAIIDEGDIVYRAADARIIPDRSTPGTEDLGFREPTLALAIDEALLFCFSALTYNAHRIHYDHNWARREGYSDLVVHGPLQALLMSELARIERHPLIGKQFTFRLVQPLIGPQRITATAVGDAGVVIRDAQGRVTATAIVNRMDF